MSDETNAPSDGAAEVTAHVEATPVETPVVSDTPSEAPKTARDALERHYDQAFDGEGQQKSADGRERNPDGTFKAKEATVEPAKPTEAKPVAPAAPVTPTPDVQPSRLKIGPDQWGATPPEVKAEVNRAIAELTQGIDKYRTAYEPIKKFDDMARQGGTTLEAALTAYTGMENLLVQDLGAGLRQLAQNLGVTPQQIAAAFGGQPAEQPAAGDNAEVAALKQQLAQATQAIASLKGEFSGFTQNLTQRELQTEIERFKGDPAHSRFDELSPTMAQLLKGEVAKDLAEAYQMAERLNPAANVQAPAAQTPGAVQTVPAQQPKPTDPAHTGKAKLSISGSPAGSDPGQRKPPDSARSALERAAASVGI